MEEVEAGHHRGPRRDDVGEGNLPSEGEGECDVHIHRGRNTRAEAGWVTVHDNGPGGCILEEPGTFGHIHPWEGMADVGNETDMGPGRDGLHDSVSGNG